MKLGEVGVATALVLNVLLWVIWKVKRNVGRKPEMLCVCVWSCDPRILHLESLLAAGQRSQKLLFATQKPSEANVSGGMSIQFIWRSGLEIPNDSAQCWQSHCNLILPPNPDQIPEGSCEWLCTSGMEHKHTLCQTKHRGNSVGFTLAYCLSCLVRIENLINSTVFLIHLNVIFRECEIIKQL